jgi:K+-sensing histidine kinase KdpD
MDSASSTVMTQPINPPSLDEDRERMHRQMMSSVSHDLKTPLASIIGSLEVYERMHQKLPEERREALIRVALQEAYRLDAFVTNILDMAKFENGSVKVRKEAINLKSLIENCTTRLNDRLSDSAVRVEASSGEIEAHTDSTLLCRALMLILDNAVKYGSTQPAVRIRYGKEGDHGFIEARDNGPGIAETRLESIFSKYTRFPIQDKQIAGTGLGLAICREIMRLLGGSVMATNHPDGGAVFKLSFPLE